MPPQFGLKSFFGFGKNKVNPNELQRRKMLKEKERESAEKMVEKDKKAKKLARKEAAKNEKGGDEISIKDEDKRQEMLTE